MAQDSFDIGADKGRSSYDRPHRLTGNFVWELPWMRQQQGIAGKILGGWQVSSFFTLQSGAPFTALNGSDPTGALARDRRPRRQRHPAEPQHRPRSVEDDDRGDPRRRRRGRSGSLFRRLCGMPSATCAGERVGNAPRNPLRADGIGNLDFSLIKNTRFANGQNLQIRIEMFNATNTRNFGIPDGRVNSAELPEPVGDRRRSPADLGSGPLHLLRSLAGCRPPSRHRAH